MNLADLESIGLTQEELQNRVVSAIVGRLLTTSAFDWEEDCEYPTNSQFSRKLTEGIQAAIDAKFESLVASNIVPVIATKVDELVIQRTNLWGEKKGAPVTFLEYLIERADQVMAEPLDKQGRTRAECERGGNSFYEVKGSNRIAAAVDKCLTTHLQECANTLVKEAQTKVAASLGEVLKSALIDAQSKLKVTVTR